MSKFLMTRDPGRICPDCGERGGLDFVEVPKNRRAYVDDHGVECTDHFGESRDYQCRNCACEFTLTRWEPL